MPTIDSSLAGKERGFKAFSASTIDAPSIMECRRCGSEARQSLHLKRMESAPNVRKSGILGCARSESQEGMSTIDYAYVRANSSDSVRI